MQLAVALVIAVASLAAFQDFESEDRTREPGQRATQLLAALQLSQGDWAAEIGAGSGYYAMRMSPMVGPEGKVIAEDISDASIRSIHARVKSFGLQNVEIVKGTADNPKLPLNWLAGVLIVDSYHHFTHPSAMLEKIRGSLIPGGRLVIADYSFPDHRSQPRREQMRLHEIDSAIVRKDLETAGFEILKCEDPFVKRTGVNPRIRAPDMWMIVASRPEA